MITGSKSVRPVPFYTIILNEDCIRNYYNTNYTSIIVKPPDVDSVLFLFPLEQGYSVHDAFGQFVSSGIPVARNCIARHAKHLLMQFLYLNVTDCFVFFLFLFFFIFLTAVGRLITMCTADSDSATTVTSVSVLVL